MSTKPFSKTRQIPVFTSIKFFLQEVQLELKKAVWPSREQTSKLTAIVIAISLLVGFFLGTLDTGFFDLLSVARVWVKTLIV